MSSGAVKVLDVREAHVLSRDAKIVSIRWELVPWGLVLDCNIRAEEDVNDPPICRAWIIFNGLSEISWPAESVRLPNGIVCTDVITSCEDSSGFYKYEIPILAPIFKEDMLCNNPHALLVIRARGLIGAVSVNQSTFGELGPDRSQRNSLAKDEDFLQAIESMLDASSKTP